MPTERDTELFHRFANLTYSDFRRMARDDSLSPCEKAGFPDSYRKGKESSILADILVKLDALGGRGKRVLDIGPGCSALPVLLIDLCRDRGHSLLLVDSDEVLGQLPDGPLLEKHPGYFPDCAEQLGEHRGRIDVILSYSVLHYVFVESSVWDFLDAALELLAPGGQLLLGDIPNVSKRKRFFASAAGIRYHQEFTGTAEAPAVAFNRPERRQIDDAVVLGLLGRARAAGFDAYVVPQGPALPLANRREDILVTRP
jgi:hypothetical protein